MTRTVRLCGSAGSSGSACSRESRAAAAWAAREAGLLRQPPVSPHVREPERSSGDGRAVRETAGPLHIRHPDPGIRTQRLTGRPADVLAGLAPDAAPPVLGPRAPGRVPGTGRPRRPPYGSPPRMPAGTGVVLDRTGLAAARGRDPRHAPRGRGAPSGHEPRAAEVLDKAPRDVPAGVVAHRRTAERHARTVLVDASYAADPLVGGAGRGHRPARHLGRVAHGVPHRPARPVAMAPGPE
ncbi:hypothetical protein ACFYTV_06275 [Streptomyces sp. NPDC004562]|uniref:hypothetical protein n=1 Tax=Streptomyces sp. NPDC004562 TaxID=3364703 RepID=UPI0036A6A9A0